ncbi:hypothetical protein ACX40Y_10560 [Sphingomonas sp. RS6]
MPLALLLQLATVLLARLFGIDFAPGLWLGAFCAIAVCVTREITQREYQWIERFGDGLRRNMPVFAGYRFWEWNSHSKRESIAAALSVILVAGVVSVASWA